MDIEANLVKDDFSKGKRALEIENGLLKILREATTEYQKDIKPGTLGNRIVNDWLGTFNDLYDFNETLIKPAYPDFRKDLEEEIEALDEFIKATKENKIGMSWKMLFKGDKDIAERLLNK